MGAQSNSRRIHRRGGPFRSSIRKQNLSQVFDKARRIYVFLMRAGGAVWPRLGRKMLHDYSKGKRGGWGWKYN